MYLVQNKFALSLFIHPLGEEVLLDDPAWAKKVGQGGFQLNQSVILWC